RRSRRGDHGRRGRARAAQDDDRDRHRRGPAAHPVERRHGLRGHAAYRRADDRRHGELDGADAAGDPGDLWARQRMATATVTSDDVAVARYTLSMTPPVMSGSLALYPGRGLAKWSPVSTA